MITVIEWGIGHYRTGMKEKGQYMGKNRKIIRKNEGRGKPFPTKKKKNEECS